MSGDTNLKEKAKGSRLRAARTVNSRLARASTV